MNLQTGIKRELTGFLVGNAVVMIGLVIFARTVLL